MWFAGRVDQRRVALGEHSGHHRVLGRGHARLVHEETVADQSVRRPQHEVALNLDLGTKCGKSVEVRIDAAAANHVTTGRRHKHRATTRQERPSEQDRGANLHAEGTIDLWCNLAGSLDAERVLFDPLDLGAHGLDELSHHLGVADPRNVLDDALLVRQETGRDDRQRTVLVATDRDATRERLAAFDHE